MKKITFFCLSLFLLVAFPPPAEATFTWDKDTVANCEERAEGGRCFQDATTFYQCPATCSKEIRDRGLVKKHGETEEPESFWELEVKVSDGKKMSFERYEGYVTLVVVLPLMPGMAQYYYDMLEHIHKVYPFTIEIIVIPVRREDHPDLQLTVPEKSKILVLPELTRDGDKIESSPVLEYLEGVIAAENNFIYTVSPFMLSSLLFSIIFCADSFHCATQKIGSGDGIHCCL